MLNSWPMNPSLQRFGLFTVLAFLVFSLVAQAAEIQQANGPVRKLQRGFLNMVLSPFEISHELAKVKKEDKAIPSWIGGAGRGAFYAVGRSLVGIYEVVTAPIAFPARYEPVINPEFPWEYASLPEEGSEGRTGSAAQESIASKSEHSPVI